MAVLLHGASPEGKVISSGRRQSFVTQGARIACLCKARSISHKGMIAMPVARATR